MPKMHAFGSCRVRHPRSWIFLTVLAALASADAAAAAVESSGKVELRCKILPAVEGIVRPKVWRVELRKSTGEPVETKRQVRTGDAIRFKGLDPGIYICCIIGKFGRQQCRSVDLYTPGGANQKLIEKQFRAPAIQINRVDLHQVHLWKLAIPDEARDEFLKSGEAQDQGDIKAVAEHLERAVEIYPSYVDAWNNLGAYYHLKGDYNKAIEKFSTAVEIDPDYYPSWVNLGGSLLARQKLGEALEATLNAERLRPGTARIVAQIGLIHYYRRDYEQAREKFEEVLKLDPASAVGPDLYLAHIAFAQKRRAEGIDHLRDYIKRHPNSPNAARLRKTVHNLSRTLTAMESSGKPKI